MTGSSAVRDAANASLTSTDAFSWHRWCRLCAKEHPDNVNVYFRNDDQTWTSVLAVAIGKYFWVNVSLGHFVHYHNIANRLQFIRSKWRMS